MQAGLVRTAFVACLSSALLFVALRFIPAMRVGDGSEYYAMYTAWVTTLKPFMTAPSWAVFNELCAHGGIGAMMDQSIIGKFFPALQLREAQDFNHFWLYSLMAACMHAIFHLHAHGSFLIVHALLFALVLIYARRLYGMAGVKAALILTLGAPILWYMNKVHSEFYTHTTTLIALMCAGRKRWVESAFFFALAAAQNISFAAIAAIPFAYFILTPGARRYTRMEVMLAIATALVVLAHPIYYLTRFGVITPQLLAGGAELGAHFDTALLWFFDLDNGLLPNWPLGIALLLVGLATWRKRDTGLAYGVIVTAYLAVSLYAQSSTVNLNSGATPGLARYALWYIPLFFPFALRAQEWMRVTSSRRLFSLLVLIFGLVWNAIFYSPTRTENYTDPTPASAFVQRHLPHLYNPPEEIFFERFGALGERNSREGIFAVIGPDCRKLLVIHPEADTIATRAACGFDAAALHRLLGERPGPYWRHLSAEESASLLAACPSRLDLHRSGFEASLSGFSTAEPQGRWTDGRHAILHCRAEGEGIRQITLDASAFVLPNHAQRLTVSVNGKRLTKTQFTTEHPADKLTISLPHPAQGEFLLELYLPDAASPQKLAGGSDTRHLGLMIKRIELLP